MKQVIVEWQMALHTAIYLRLCAQFDELWSRNGKK